MAFPNISRKSFPFYKPLEVSPDGKYIFLKEDIFDVKTGALVDYEPPDRVERFVSGHDGRTYLVTSSSIFEWIPGPNGFEIGRSVTWDTSRRRNFRPDVQVDKNQVIWINYFEQLVWLNFDGQVLGQKTPNFDSGSLNRYDFPNGLFIECQRDRATEVLTCTAITPGKGDLIWQVEVAGVPNFEPGQATIEDDYLLVLSEDQVLSKYFIGQP